MSTENDEILEILNPGETFTLWNKIHSVHIKVVEGPGKILRSHALLFADDLAKRNCVVDEELQDLSEEKELAPSGRKSGRPKKEPKE